MVITRNEMVKQKHFGRNYRRERAEWKDDDGSEDTGTSSMLTALIDRRRYYGKEREGVTGCN